MNGDCKPKLKDILVVAVDVGARCGSGGSFAFDASWLCNGRPELKLSEEDQKDRRSPNKWPDYLFEVIKGALNENRKVALGLEAPLYIPIDLETKDGLIMRECDKNEEGKKRPWYAQPGAAALAQGIGWMAWLFKKLRDCVDLRVTVNWKEFLEGNYNLFVWEAFVSWKTEKKSHLSDARAALCAFQEKVRMNCQNPPFEQCRGGLKAGSKGEVELPNNLKYLNLVGVALIWAGLHEEGLAIIKEPCCVVKPKRE